MYYEFDLKLPDSYPDVVLRTQPGVYWNFRPFYPPGF